LFLLRARNLYTAENIGRWRTQLDDYGGENRRLVLSTAKRQRKSVYGVLMLMIWLLNCSECPV
ncbi:hypothetical protein ACVST6_22800, partial [Yersinia enterocolitica]